VRDGVDGVLVPRGDAQALAVALRDLWHEPERRIAMARAAAAEVARFAWPRVAGQVLEAYEDAVAVPAPAGAARRLAVRTGARPADLQPVVHARRLDSLEPAPKASGRKRAVSVARRLGFVGFSVAALVLAVLALRTIGIGNITSALLNSSPTWVIVGLAVMCSAMAMRAVSWLAILRAALPRDAPIRLSDSLQGTFIGVLMSSTLPARLGEPARALVVARRTGRPRETLPIVLGSLVSQTLLNILALMILGAVMFSSVNIFSGHQQGLLFAAIAPVALLALVLIAPLVLRRGPAAHLTSGRLAQWLAQARRAMTRVRAGLSVFRDPKLGATAIIGQLAAWALQWVSCYTLMIALGLDHEVGIGAAAAVLFAVNISAVLPATPANLGVFQFACAAVLSAGWHVSWSTGVAYGVILQAVEVATAVLMGGPALLKEGMSWREVRMRAIHAAPVKLPAHASVRADGLRQT
jgi:phosphatidyl-myo-inositol alpha-mannosyltransferase